MRILGVDLAWGEGSLTKKANETGVVAVQTNGQILDAGWTSGVAETVSWIEKWSGPNAIAMIDAPLVISNAKGQRLCEKQVGQKYYSWKVCANSSNLNSKRQAGVRLRLCLEQDHWKYDSGLEGPPMAGCRLSEVYPYTTIVGIEELNYSERPLYKRKPRAMRVAQFRQIRAKACQLLLSRLAKLEIGNARIDLHSHPVTEELLTGCDFSAMSDKEYKHREDLIDALICAWTGLLWINYGFDRCQVLGATGDDLEATIIAPARGSQILQPGPDAAAQLKSLA